MKLAQVTKAVAALSTGVAVVVAAGLITGNTAVWLTTGIGALSTTLAVYLAPRNQP